MSDYCACGAVHLPPPIDYVVVDNYEHTRSLCHDQLTNEVLKEQQR